MINIRYMLKQLHILCHSRTNIMLQTTESWMVIVGPCSFAWAMGDNMRYMGTKKSRLTGLNLLK